MKDNIFYPCMCANIANGTLLKDSFKLIDLYGIVDSTYSHFEMDSMTVRKENILYIAEGEYTKKVLNELNPKQENLEDSSEDFYNHEDGE